MTEQQVEPFHPDGDGLVDYLYIKLADHITARIRAGQLPPGARLPNERDLAAEYEVSIGTVRRATYELRSRGLVRTLPGRGTFIANPAQALSLGVTEPRCPGRGNRR